MDSFRTIDWNFRYHGQFQNYRLELSILWIVSKLSTVTINTMDSFKTIGWSYRYHGQFQNYRLELSIPWIVSKLSTGTFDTMDSFKTIDWNYRLFLNYILEERLWIVPPG
ncbi:hypothetical protein AVEN_213892-1 [Araneus ventricosus]|uniref:Uncharacterized protein n=1 Tax=Araneus ventricosus TaxID=182803 RepID=A0A4Y2KEM8_ARAVE|nr:hypothetical protein AVEN_213892-1 [Araneus ventricosus]